MEEVALISLMAVLVLLSAFCSIVLGKLKIPSLIGFLVAGIIIANTMTLSADAHTVIEVFSNLGLILLMFSIGMEIDVRKLKSQGRFAVVVAAIQLPLMVVGGMVAGTILGYNSLQSLALGCIISGSSTAVVMAVLKSQGKLKTEDIETLVLVVIMEDIGQVIMLSMLTPMLNGSEMSMDELTVLIIKIAIFMVACFTVGLYVVPRVIDYFYKKANDELISLLCIGAAFTLAWAASGMGLSVAIGAFLAGVFVGMSRPHHAVEHFVEPLKSVFMAMFFISVGMEVAIGSLVANIIPILVIFATFVICKIVTVYFGWWVGNGDSRTGFLAAVSLCAIGEFAFIIAKEALDCGVVDEAFYSSVIGASLISMLALPLLSKYSDRAFDGMMAKCPGFLKRFFAKVSEGRNGIYSDLGAVSSRTRGVFTRGLSTVYFCLFLVIIIEIVFIEIYGPVSEWATARFTFFDNTEWRLVILVANFFALLTPCIGLTRNIRTVTYILAVGKQKESNTAKDPDKVRYYEVMNPIIVAGGVDILIILIMPNGIDAILHFAVFAVILVAITLHQLWKIKSGRKGLLPDIKDDEPAESQ